ncbi:MAG: glycine--tRNA ligase subunit beta [Planctomycetales bacterium]|nr:glycine--tRNA ligase subunit beta [Planctomycetales bacterium]
MPDLLVEIGTEEIPAGYLRGAVEALAEGLRRECAAAGLGTPDVRGDSTPRRLALLARGIPATQPGSEKLVRGPTRDAAYDAGGNPTPVAQKFAAAQGVPVSALEVRETPKGAYVHAMRREGGAATLSLLPGMLERALAAVVSPKSMRWGPPGVRFARPIRSLLALFGADVVPATLAGVRASGEARGHRFLAPGPVRMGGADWEEYREKLRAARVVVETAERVRLVRGAVEASLARDGGAFTREALAEEVANLLEWPTPVEGTYDEAYLALPDAILEAAMVHHQRYFPVRGRDGKLRARFVAFADRGGDAAGEVRAGNERVLRARLSDARFFFEGDRKKPLAARVEGLREMGVQPDLGSLRDRADRVARLATRLASSPRAPAAVRALAPARIERAAQLAKADLLTEVVGEFPELQGVMGEIYARLDGEPEEVAVSIRDHYQPRAAKDPLPATPLGLLLALADRAMALAEGFALGREPTGAGDAFGLRRAAYGLLRLLREGLGAGKVSGIVHAAVAELPAGKARSAGEAKKPAIAAFLADRLSQAALDAGHPHDLVRAVIASGADEPADVFARLEALRRLAAEPGWPGLVEVVDRTKRILPKDWKPRLEMPAGLALPEEQVLQRAFDGCRGEVQRLLDARDYVPAARLYRDSLAAPVHEFFAKVFVNDPDPAVRENRLTLLSRVNRLFSERVADLALVEGVVGGAAATRSAGATA